MSSTEGQRPEEQSVDDATVIVPPPAPETAMVEPPDVAPPKVDLFKRDDESSTPYYESEWTPAYAQTEIRPAVPPEPSYSDPAAAAYSDPAAAAYADPVQQSYGQASPQQPVPQPAYGYGAPYAAPYQQPMAAAPYNLAQGQPPNVSNTSAILAVVFSGLLIAGCYTTLFGIAPLVFGIMSLNKSNSVAKLWYMGQKQAAYEAGESSKNLAKWAWISMAIGLAIFALLVVAFIIALANS